MARGGKVGCRVLRSLSDIATEIIQTEPVEHAGITFSGADEPANAALLLHEPARRRDLDLCAGGVHARQLHPVRDGTILAVRVAQPPPVPGGLGRRREPVLGVELVLVHHRDVSPPGLGTESEGEPPELLKKKKIFRMAHPEKRVRQLSENYRLGESLNRRKSSCSFPAGDFDKDRRGHLVVLHTHHYLILHCQPSSFSHRREDDHSDRERGGPRGADGDLLRDASGRIDNDVLQGNYPGVMNKILQLVILDFEKSKITINSNFKRAPPRRSRSNSYSRVGVMHPSIIYSHPLLGVSNYHS